MEGDRHLSRPQLPGPLRLPVRSSLRLPGNGSHASTRVMDPTLTHLFASITPPEGRQECPTETRPNLTEAVPVTIPGRCAYPPPQFLFRTNDSPFRSLQIPALMARTLMARIGPGLNVILGLAG